MEAPKFTGTPLAFTRSDRHGACYILRSTHSLMAAATVDGLLSGGRFSYRNFHRIISCGTSSGDGKSSCMIHLYCIVEFNISCTNDGRHQSKQRCGSG